MDLILLVLGLALLGYILYLIETKVQMDTSILWLIRIVVVIAVVLYLIRTFGHLIPNVLGGR